MAPVVLIEELCVIAAADTVAEVKAEELPTAAPNPTLPAPAVRLNVCPPSIVLVLPTNEIFFPPALVFIATAPIKLTGPVIEIAPVLVVVILLPIEIVPALL